MIWNSHISAGAKKVHRSHFTPSRHFQTTKTVRILLFLMGNVKNTVWLTENSVSVQYWEVCTAHGWHERVHFGCQQNAWAYVPAELRLHKYQNGPRNPRWSHEKYELAVDQLTTPYFQWFTRVRRAQGWFEIVIFLSWAKSLYRSHFTPSRHFKTIQTVRILLFLMGNVKNTIRLTGYSAPVQFWEVCTAYGWFSSVYFAYQQNAWACMLTQFRLHKCQNRPRNHRWSRKSCGLAVEQMTASFY